MFPDPACGLAHVAYTPQNLLPGNQPSSNTPTLVAFGLTAKTLTVLPLGDHQSVRTPSWPNRTLGPFRISTMRPLPYRSSWRPIRSCVPAASDPARPPDILTSTNVWLTSS